MLIQLAWRNVWRNKTRSFVILAAAAVGLWGGIFSDAFMSGMTKQQVYSSIHTETGHLQLNAPGFLRNHDLQIRMPDADSLVDVIRAIPGVEAASSTIQLTAMGSTASGSTGVMVNGIDPAGQCLVSDVHRCVIRGRYFDGGSGNAVVIGQQLADKLHLTMHSHLVLTLQTTSGDITYSAFRVEGIFRTHNSDFDKQMIFVRKEDLRPIIKYPVGAASLLTVLLHRDGLTGELATSLRKRFPGLQVRTWEQLSPMLQVLSGTVMQMSFIFVGIILVALAFGIVNTMLMSVMDRTREFGMLLAIGMEPSRVFGMIILETVLLSLTGAAAGVGFSIGTIAWFGRSGINLSMIAEGANALGYSSIVYPSIDPGFYAVLAGMVMAIALISGFFPARKAVRLSPAEAVRGD